MRGYTGGLLEADTLPPVLAPARLEGHVSYSQAMRAWGLVKANQPWDPAEPSALVSRFASDLHTLVGEAFGLKELSSLRLFTAVGSALDRHGVDGWVELYGMRVTFDVTQNSDKITHGYKADVIVDGEVVDGPVLLRYVAREIAQCLAASFRRQLGAIEACSA